MWEIPYNEIEVGERIGSGSFGTVYKGKWHGKRERGRGGDVGRERVCVCDCVCMRERRRASSHYPVVIHRSCGCEEAQCI